MGTRQSRLAGGSVLFLEVIMPHLRASALEEDPLGCALLLQVLHSTRQEPIMPASTPEAAMIEAAQGRPDPGGAMPSAQMLRQNRRRVPSPPRPVQTKRSA
jgi:hypothetical protein